MANEHAKRPHATKIGPGRYHAAVKSGNPKKISFAAGVQNAAAKKRAEAMLLTGLRDKYGKFTLTGRKWVMTAQGVLVEAPRRMWIAGISAQRGF